jgi:hypothetical protein
VVPETFYFLQVCKMRMRLLPISPCRAHRHFSYGKFENVNSVQFHIHCVVGRAVDVVSFLRVCLCLIDIDTRYLDVIERTLKFKDFNI